MRVLSSMDRAGTTAARWSIVVLLLWIGTFKFSPVEAAAIRPLVENSPFMGWLYGLFSEQAVSNLLGGTEIVVALAMAVRGWYPKASFCGSLAAVGIFLVTFSFFLTTPGTLAVAAGYPLPVPTAVGFFLVKDIVLSVAALMVAVEAGTAAGVLPARPSGTAVDVPTARAA